MFFATAEGSFLDVFLHLRKKFAPVSRVGAYFKLAATEIEYYFPFLLWASAFLYFVQKWFWSTFGST
jgi:hypothetical protein